ncbi:MAG: glycosyltransferase family 4 protein [bacterium]
MRIAYLLADRGIPFTASQKGGSIHARELVRALEKEGCEVDVFVMKSGRSPQGKPKVHEPTPSRLTRFFQKWFLDGRRRPVPNWMDAVNNLLWQRDFLRMARRRCERKRPDVIYARNAWLAFSTIALKRIFKVPLVLEVNALFTIEKKARGQIAFARLTRAIELRTLRCADLILPVSEALREQLLACGIDTGKIVVTPNAVDLELFQPAASVAERYHDGAERDFVVGCVHSFKTYHGTETLLGAAALLKERIPGLRLLLIGKGEEFDKCRRLAANLGLDGIVEFKGLVPYDEVPELLSRCSALVAPYRGSQNLYNCPMKLYEYMALRVPIVASRWGEIPRILKDEKEALLHAEDKPEALAERLLRLYRDPELGKRLSAAAYEIVRNWTWRHVARRILDWAAERSKQMSPSRARVPECRSAE